ncbi:MAG: hypothetical protein K6C08_09175 [Oscillospiraceae bacterium]|nr:hypothetical protein [Oscillospiraceae bacterium]
MEEKSEKLTRRERHRRWKEARRQKWQEKKDYYRYAPWLKRVWNLYLKKPIAVLMVIAILSGVLAVNMTSIFESVVVPIMQQYYFSMKDAPLSEADLPKIYKESPLDEEGGKRIDALAPVNAEDTWTICVYMIGSNLEDHDENDLSYVVDAQTKDTRTENKEKNRQQRLANISRFEKELSENGLELPAFFYYPETPVASSTVVKDEVKVSDRTGAATLDIEEMTADVWSDNIRIVIQPGGATRWSNDMINPNRTQRFLYEKGNFSEVSNLRLQPSASPETLADFLQFCEDEYPSDHRILVLWNHGGGPFGYGNETITGDMFSLKEIRTALESVYQPSNIDPAFDIIGFDACLMSTLEVTNTLDGFADYYCLSEEVEPGDGWDYSPWLQAMTDDPTMNAAQVGRAIADSYTDYYMKENVNLPEFGQNVTFSVLDAHKAGSLYRAYSELCRAQLKDAAADLGVLADIGRCGSRATAYAHSDYDVFNVVDLGNYVDYMIDSYPEECSKIKDLIGETVLYHRENGALSDSTGIAVYLPTKIRDLYGLVFYLDYVYNISTDDSISALYYYKQAGCLNDELKEHVKSLTDTEPEILDITPFREYTKAEPSLDSEGFMLPVNEKLQKLIVSYELQIGRYDEKADTVTYYGQDRNLGLDGEGHLVSEFDGEWICLNGEPLAVEVVSSTPSGTEYCSRVLYKGKECYLLFTRDNSTDQFTITGIHEISDDEGGLNYLHNTRSDEELEPGSRIKPIYSQTNLADSTTKKIYGKQVIFNTKTTVSLKSLPEGYYLTTAVISDPRGDSYYSTVCGADISGGNVKEWKLDPRFYGRDY